MGFQVAFCESCAVECFQGDVVENGSATHPCSSLFTFTIPAKETTKCRQLMLNTMHKPSITTNTKHQFRLSNTPTKRTSNNITTSFNNI